MEPNQGGEADGGRGGREVERGETSVNPAFPGDAKRPRQTSGGGSTPTPRTTRREASHLLAKGGPGGRAVSTSLSATGCERSAIHSREASGGPGGCAASTPQLHHAACGGG